MSDAPDTQVTVDVDVQAGERGLEAIVRQAYAPPLDGKSDDYVGFDLHTAKEIFEILSKHYFGYDWKTFADTKQGVVGFSIPELMGPTLHMVVNLKQFSDLTPQLIVNKGGELLERMNLPRTQADMARVLFARQHKHTFDFSDVKH